MVDASPLLLSVIDAAGRLSISRATLYKLISSGAVRAIRIGGRTLVSVEALETYIASLESYKPSDRFDRTHTLEVAKQTPERLLRVDAVMERTGLGKTSIYMRCASGTFPRKVIMGSRAACWRESEIDAWITDPLNYRAE